MYQKEIIYLNLMSQEVKEKNAGFCKIEKKQDIYQIDLQIKNSTSNSGTFPIRIQTPDGWKEINTVTIASGCGSFIASMKEEVYRIEIILSDVHKIVGQSKTAPLLAKPELPKKTGLPEKAEPVMQAAPMPDKIELPEKAESVMQAAPMPDKIELPKKEEPVMQAATVAVKTEPRPQPSPQPQQAPQPQPEVPLYEDKWEQLLTTYEKIHPYGDERTYIKLEPKDFVILRSNYQHLVNNSFLLHGFYNYRYLILGREKDFYIGVPGVFYEREKMVALMFGFEAFECEGGMAEEGKFGYYLRKVEL